MVYLAQTHFHAWCYSKPSPVNMSLRWISTWIDGVSECLGSDDAFRPFVDLLSL